eukprot:gene9236-1322_t
MHDFEDSNVFETSPQAKCEQKYKLITETLLGIATWVFSIFGFALLMLAALYFSNVIENTKVIECGSKCSMRIVETIPHQVDLQTNVKSTYSAFHKLITEAKHSIKISAFYVTLTNNAHEGNGKLGNQIYHDLIAAKNKTPSIQITIVQNLPNERMPSDDAEFLYKTGVVSELVNINMKSGVQHAKFIITDETNFYLGSANIDWRALSQVKELGIVVEDCPCMADDLSKIYGIWLYFGKTLNSTISMGYPTKFDTSYNSNNPLLLKEQNSTVTYSNFISSSPETINSLGRTTELTALISAIKNAKDFVYISVMDMVPFEVYGKKQLYWGELFDSIRFAVSNGVDVKIIVSQWNSTKPQMYTGLENLQNFGDFCVPRGGYQWCNGNITVKVIQLPDPTDYEPYPFTRVNHAKYVVTDQICYISTSNWSKDYFYSTLGVGFFTTNKKVNLDVKNIFLRDFNSKFSKHLKNPTLIQNWKYVFDWFILSSKMDVETANNSNKDEELEDNQLLPHVKKRSKTKLEKSEKNQGVLALIGQGILFCVLVILIIGVLVASVASIILFAEIDNIFKNNTPCGTSCEFSLVESIPDQIDLQSPEGVLKTSDIFKKLILSAEDNLKIGAFYWTLNNTRDDAGGNVGNEILESIYEAKRKNPNLRIEVVQQAPLERFPNKDTEIMLKNGIISTISNIDVSKLFVGGVQHSKFLIADGKDFYVGSNNFDWRSFTQVKELGVYVQHCPCLGQDITKIFDLWQYFGSDLDNIPSSSYPIRFATDFTESHPFKISQTNSNDSFTAFLAQSPPLIKVPSRSSDLTSFLHSIHHAEKFVNISVMDFYPFEIYGEEKNYWDELDMEIKEAMLRGVKVNLLISKWNHTNPEMIYALESMQSFSKICNNPKWCKGGTLTIKLFELPDAVGYPASDFTRVNHAKYMITENELFISTSNFSEDYFYKTFGIGFFANSPQLMNTLKLIFNRDWESKYSTILR